MAAAANPSTAAGISIGQGVGAVTEWLRQITVRVSSSRSSHGSGVVWNAGGLIVTNAHVALSDMNHIEFANGTRTEARIIARDPHLDLAALKLGTCVADAAFPRSARTLRVGEMVIAVGNPWDGAGAVCTGMVHRTVGNAPWLVTDIRLAPGNSGGPLADAQGNVVGINSMIIDGLGWAVTSDAVAEFLERARLVELL